MRPASSRHYDGFFSAFAFFFFFFIAMVVFLWVSVKLPGRWITERRRRCPWAQPLAMNKNGIAVSTAQSKNGKTADISVA
jgi:hypothetical protein